MPIPGRLEALAHGVQERLDLACPDVIRDPEADINADPDSGVEVTAVKLFARVTGIGVAGVTITDDTPEDFDEDEC